MLRSVFVANIFTALTLCGAITALAQDPTVDKKTIWVDKVDRGDMTIQARCLGQITSAKTAEIRLPEQQTKQVAVGQTVLLDTRAAGIVSGTVAKIGPAVAGQTVVAVDLKDALPAGVAAGREVDGLVQITKFVNVLNVGRPVSGQADAEGVLFKVDADGQHASKVKVRFGRASVNRIEIIAGLQPGDRVILSDMSAYARHDRVKLQ